MHHRPALARILVALLAGPALLSLLAFHPAPDQLAAPRIATTATVSPPVVTPTVGENEPPPDASAPSGGAQPLPTPTPRAAGTPPRVGIQVGHWKIDELPEELARLRRNGGTSAGGVTELEVNLAVGQRIVELLRREGIVADLLPATVPPGYDADAFVAVHADGSSSTAARGYKFATPWRTSRASQQLNDLLYAEYGATTGLPRSDAITINMKGYYAFNYFRHTHAITRTTPAVIMEMGYITNPTDRAFLTKQTERVATGVVRGLRRYLAERNPLDGAALIPPEYQRQRAIADGVAVRAAPRESAALLARIGPQQRLLPFEERDGWYHIFTRVGEKPVIGWVRKDQVAATTEPMPTPLPAEDSSG